MVLANVPGDGRRQKEGVIDEWEETGLEAKIAAVEEVPIIPAMLKLSVLLLCVGFGMAEIQMEGMLGVCGEDKRIRFSRDPSGLFQQIFHLTCSSQLSHFGFLSLPTNYLFIFLNNFSFLFLPTNYLFIFTY